MIPSENLQLKFQSSERAQAEALLRRSLSTPIAESQCQQVLNVLKLQDGLFKSCTSDEAQPPQLTAVWLWITIWKANILIHSLQSRSSAPKYGVASSLKWIETTRALHSKTLSKHHLHLRSVHRWVLYEKVNVDIKYINNSSLDWKGLFQVISPASNIFATSEKQNVVSQLTNDRQIHQSERSQRRLSWKQRTQPSGHFNWYPTENENNKSRYIDRLIMSITCDSLPFNALKND